MLVLARLLDQSLIIDEQYTVTLIMARNEQAVIAIKHIHDEPGSETFVRLLGDEQLNLQKYCKNLDSPVTLTVVKYNSEQKVRFGVDAPRHIRVDRLEIHYKRKEQAQ